MLENSPITAGGFPWWLDGTLGRTAEQFLEEQPLLPGCDLADLLRRDPVLTRSQFQSALEACEAIGADSQQSGSVGPTFQWDHPQGEFFAQMVFPGHDSLDESQDIAVKLYYGEASEMHGDDATGIRSVKLGTLDGRLSPEGNVEEFNIGEVKAHLAEELPLCVDGVEWPLRPPPS